MVVEFLWLYFTCMCSVSRREGMKVEVCGWSSVGGDSGALRGCIYNIGS